MQFWIFFVALQPMGYFVVHQNSINQNYSVKHFDFPEILNSVGFQPFQSIDAELLLWDQWGDDKNKIWEIMAGIG